jgi:hypothetical protein
MKILKTEDGHDSVVDDDVFEWAQNYKWSISQYGYVSRRSSLNDRIFLHRMICNTPEGWHTDHINGEKLDNLRSNLRVASTKENIRNSHRRSDNKSGYKGVHYRKDRGTYSAEICKDGIKTRLGCYKTAKQAALAYNTAAKELFGQYAWLNPID